MAKIRSWLPLQHKEVEYGDIKTMAQMHIYIAPSPFIFSFIANLQARYINMFYRFNPTLILKDKLIL